MLKYLPAILAAIVSIINIGAVIFISSMVETDHRGGFVITRPPIQISFRGSYNAAGMDHLEQLVEQVEKFPFHDYQFRENHNIRLNSIDGKADTISVQLIETTNTAQNKGKNDDEDQ